MIKTNTIWVLCVYAICIQLSDSITRERRFPQPSKYKLIFMTHVEITSDLYDIREEWKGREGRRTENWEGQRRGINKIYYGKMHEIYACYLRYIIWIYMLILNWIQTELDKRLSSQLHVSIWGFFYDSSVSLLIKHTYETDDWMHFIFHMFYILWMINYFLDLTIEWSWKCQLIFRIRENKMIGSKQNW